MNSILNNSAALSALQALQMTQQSLATVQNQVSTGLSVASAADNSSYWAIAAQLNADSGIVTASNSAMSEGQSVSGDRILGDQLRRHDAELDDDSADRGAESQAPRSATSTPRSPRSASSCKTPSTALRSTA